MPITYNAVTKITNGQAITAAVLNTPSDGLEARTDEVQRNSQYEEFALKHSVATKTIVTPTLEANVEPVVAIKHHLKNNGTVAIRSYSVGLENAVLSVYSETMPGSRFVVPGTVLSSFFSDSSSYPLESNNLYVPGDGLYLKIPTKQYTSGEAGVFANNYLPHTEAKSKSNTYVTSPTVAVSASNIVKLPLRNKVIFVFSSILSVAEFITHLQGPNGFQDESVVVTIDSTSHVLSIVDSNNVVYKLLISGVQGARCEVTKVYASPQNYLVLEVVSSTAPIYSELNKIPISGIELKIENQANNTAYDENSSIIDPSTQYIVEPIDLDPAYIHIPLVRLTETTLEVGNKSYSLVRNFVQDGSSTSSDVIGIDDTYGAPIEYLDSSMAVGTKEIRYNLLTPAPLKSSRKHTLEGVFSTIANGAIEADFSKTKEFQAMLASLRNGDTVVFLGGEVKALSTVVSNGGNASVVLLDFNSAFIYNGGTTALSTDRVVPILSLSEFGEVYWTPLTTDTNSHVIDAINKIPNRSSTGKLVVKDNDSNNALTAGALYIRLDFYIK